MKLRLWLNGFACAVSVTGLLTAALILQSVERTFWWVALLALQVGHFWMTMEEARRRLTYEQVRARLSRRYPGQRTFTFDELLAALRDKDQDA